MEIQRYIETDIQSLSPGRLLVLLYEKMMDDLVRARKSITEGDRIGMADRITHSQQIITELDHALDHKVGGEISRNLEALYNYLFLEHLAVLVDRDPRHVDNCLAVLTPLMAAWREIPRDTALDRETAGGADDGHVHGSQPSSSLFSVSA